MPNRYFNNTIDLINNTRARASDVEANFNQVEDGFDTAQAEMDLKAPIASPTFTGNVGMSGFKITDLGTPTVGTDATTKTYVDGILGSATAAAASAAAALVSENAAALSETNAAASETLAQDWATKTSGTVDGVDFSAKYYAQSINPAQFVTVASGETLTGPKRGAVTTDNDLSFDMTAGNNFSCTTSGSGTLTFTNITAGQSGFILLTNASNHTISAAATTKINAADLATISATGTYLLSYFSNGTNVYVATSRNVA